MPDVLPGRGPTGARAQDDEVRIKVHAVSLNLSDWEGLRGKPFYACRGGLFRPRNHILGSDIAGCVERLAVHLHYGSPTAVARSRACRTGRQLVMRHGPS